MLKPALFETMKNKLGLNISSVLLPGQNIDMQRWSVIACDQYTSEPGYWEDVDNFVGNSPSTLRLIFPEVYLESETEDQKAIRIKNINDNMTLYLNDNVLYEHKDAVFLVERVFSNGNTRHGLIMSVDLERYDFNKGSQSLIRATEGTIIERLPPRIRIRENAQLELPHIMLLIDDAEKTVIEPLVSKASSFSQVYSFELMKQSGSIKGWKINDENVIEDLAAALLKLADKEDFKTRYGLKDDNQDVLLFAVGDGNHSLATAKACWENLKKTLTSEELQDHPARYALVEIVNVHDNGLVFEPIHRVVFNVEHEHLLDSFVSYYKDRGCNVRIEKGSGKPESSGHAIKYVSSEGYGYLIVECPLYNIDVGTLQNFLDDYLKKNPQANIDYIHGEEITDKLGKQPGNIGFFLSKMDKNELFKTVILDGTLPRKTFSMGEASEKRFYLEARKIR
ncbi:MAG: DUF1015 domain-containing protein [Acetivibrionales bacterium]|jgi:uncharacterized protein (DUF1015 family)